MRREALVYGTLALVLAAFAGLAWLTNHPEAPWLARATSWPAVGPLAKRFRGAYLPPEPPPEPATEAREAETESVTLVRPTADGRWEVLRGVDPASAARAAEKGFVADPGALPLPLSSLPPVPALPLPASPAVAETRRAAAPAVPPPGIFTDWIQPVALDRIWLMPGAALRERPEDGAAVIATLPTIAYLPVYQRRGEWTEVAFRSRRLWAANADGDLPADVPRQARPRQLLPAQPADFARLRRARGILGRDEPNGRLGPYRLFTDVEDPELLSVLDGAALRVERAYYARYGRAPGGRAHQAVVIFRAESDYRRYAAAYKGIPGSGQEAGHAGGGVVAFFVGDRSRQEAVRTLVHELTHLLNRRALADRLPAWLEEGLAADLGLFWMEDAERPRRWRRFGEDGFEIQGIDFYGRVVVEALDEGRLPALADLLFFDREAFFAGPLTWRNYAHSVLVIRYLLDSGAPNLAAGFRSFLAATAAGRPITGGQFLDLLGVSQVELETGFREWVRTEVPRPPRSTG
jgi:hypothetical protein